MAKPFSPSLVEKIKVHVSNATWTRTTYDWRKVKSTDPNSKDSSYAFCNEAAREHSETFEGSVEVVIDLPEIIQIIARQVMSTKGGKSKLLNGLVTARTITRKSSGKITTEIPMKPGYVAVEK